VSARAQVSPSASNANIVQLSILRLAGLFVLSVHSPGIGESGARARLAFRILKRSAFESVATSMWQVVLDCGISAMIEQATHYDQAKRSLGVMLLRSLLMLKGANRVQQTAVRRKDLFMIASFLEQDDSSGGFSLVPTGPLTPQRSTAELDANAIGAQVLDACATARYQFRSVSSPA
jgi:hypothetical protein